MSLRTLLCQTLNAYCARATVESLEKETLEFIPRQPWPPKSKFARFESSRLQSVGTGILQEKVYKTRITDLDELKERLVT